MAVEFLASNLDKLNCQSSKCEAAKDFIAVLMAVCLGIHLAYCLMVNFFLTDKKKKLNPLDSMRVNINKNCRAHQMCPYEFFFKKEEEKRMINTNTKNNNETNIVFFKFRYHKTVFRSVDQNTVLHFMKISSRILSSIVSF